MKNVSSKWGARLGLVIAMLLALVLVVAACGRDNDNGDGPVTGNGGMGELPRDTEGSLTVFLWSGDGQFHADVGRRDWSPDEITAMNPAIIIATARAFNRIFPNIAINVYAREGDPAQDGIPWIQYREDYALIHGQPDIFAVHNLVDEVMMGSVADLTMFMDDPRFALFNPALTEPLNLAGRQFALPNYALPAGVYVNKSLADANNIDIPPINWTIDQYMRFTAYHSPNEFYGAMGPPYGFIDSGTRDIHYLLLNRESDEPYVRLNSDAVRNLLTMMPDAIPNAMWGQRNAGNVSDEFVNEHWWWGFRFFQQGRILANPDNAYMMGALASPGDDLYATMPDWDIFPRPSTPYMGNHVGLFLDPIAVRNFAMNDGNPEFSDEELLQTRMAWEFITFMLTDNRAWEERGAQMWAAGGDGYRAAVNDSFPVVTGADFYTQMEIWYQADRERFRDTNLMPGFQEVVRLFNDGAIVGNPDKVVPWNYDFEGSARAIAHEWLNKYEPDIAGAGDGDPHWLDNVLARLPDWDREINRRFDEGWASLYIQIERFYPKQD